MLLGDNFNLSRVAMLLGDIFSLSRVAVLLGDIFNHHYWVTSSVITTG